MLKKILISTALFLSSFAAFAVEEKYDYEYSNVADRSYEISFYYCNDKMANWSVDYQHLSNSGEFTPTEYSQLQRLLQSVVVKSRYNSKKGKSNSERVVYKNIVKSFEASGYDKEPEVFRYELDFDSFICSRYKQVYPKLFPNVMT